MNRHLNLFHFFNNNQAQFLEDNLSRAFALCLQHDPGFLDRVLLDILTPEDYHRLRQEFATWSVAEINIQRPAADLGGYDIIYAFSVTAADIDWDAIKEKKKLSNAPRTDLTVGIGDTLLLFEFKRTKEDCAAQLQGQVEVIQKANVEESGGKAYVSYHDFSWKKLLRLAELRADTGGAQALFSQEFVQFVERRYPSFFPTISLDRLPLATETDGAIPVRVSKRLDYLKKRMGEYAEYTFEDSTGARKRTNLRVGWGWAREVLIDADVIDGQEYLLITVFGGETKKQGTRLWRNGFSIDQLVEANREKDTLTVQPYLKWRHFNTPVADLFVSPSVAVATHNPDFFQQHAGRHKKGEWETKDSLERILDELDQTWRSASEYDKAITESNRSYYDFSVGVRLQLRLPYAEIQAVEKQGEQDTLAWLKEKINTLKQLATIEESMVRGGFTPFL
jgi:hypothetical protein